MKLIIAGSRTIDVSPQEIEALLNYYNLKPTEIVSGTARGVDSSGERFSLLYQLKLKQFPAGSQRYVYTYIVPEPEYLNHGNGD